MVKPASNGKVRVKQDADYIFHELTRSICPECKTVIDAQILIQDNKVHQETVVQLYQMSMVQELQ